MQNVCKLSFKSFICNTDKLSNIRQNTVIHQVCGCQLQMSTSNVFSFRSHDQVSWFIFLFLWPSVWQKQEVETSVTILFFEDINPMISSQHCWCHTLKTLKVCGRPIWACFLPSDEIHHQHQLWRVVDGRDGKGWSRWTCRRGRKFGLNFLFIYFYDVAFRSLPVRNNLFNIY